MTKEGVLLGDGIYTRIFTPLIIKLRREGQCLNTDAVGTLCPLSLWACKNTFFRSSGINLKFDVSGNFNFEQLSP